MLKLLFDKKDQNPLNILCFGAHSDDIEIGCGGTILRLIKEYPHLSVHWVVFGSQGIRTREANVSAEEFLSQVREKEIIIKEFRDGYFPYIGAQIKDYFEQLKAEIDPDLIFTHYRQDLHQDHRLISELTWNTYRNHLILEYEILKYDGDFGSPNFFVHLDEVICDQKINYIMTNFKSQENRHWFTEDAFRSILRLRGIESGSLGDYAEAYYCRKLALGER